MKTLVVVRCFDLDFGTKSLTSHGNSEMQMLVDRLLPLFSGKKVHILSSVIQGAKDCAQILAKAFDVTVETHDLLGSNHSLAVKLPAALQFVKSKCLEADVLILVTHLEFCKEFPSYYSSEVLEVAIPPVDMEKGEAVIIDCNDKNYQ